MADGDEPHLTEPMVVQCLYCSGVIVQRTNHLVRLVGWVDMPEIEDHPPERRIIARTVMTPDKARQLRRDLQRILSKGSH